MSDESIEHLRGEVKNLRAELAALRETADSSIGRTTRRGLLGAAAAGAVAALATDRPATAAADPVLMETINECEESTEIKFPSDVPVPRNHMLIVNDGLWNPAAPGAVEEHETGRRAAVASYSGLRTMHAYYGQANSGYRGASGGRFMGITKDSYGVHASGVRAPIRISRDPDQLFTLPPLESSSSHNHGEFFIDDNNDVWVCVEDGTPGTWRKIAGPTSAGAFHPIEPVRAYDSRRAAIPNSGKFAADTNRLISVKDGRDVTSGAVTTPDAVPDGATAITYNVTITGTVGAGFVFVAPGDATSITSSTINWASSGTTIANGSTVKLDGSRQVKVFCAVNESHVILDITGYYL